MRASGNRPVHENGVAVDAATPDVDARELGLTESFAVCCMFEGVLHRQTV